MKLFVNFLYGEIEWRYSLLYGQRNNVNYQMQNSLTKNYIRTPTKVDSHPVVK